MPLGKQIKLTICLFLGFHTILIGQTHGASGDGATTPQHERFFEVITSVVNVYSSEEDNNSIGNEIHFMYWFNHQLGSGLSLTTKQSEGDLIYDTALIGSWSPVKWLTTNIGPNISWESDHRDFGFSAYLELEINFFVIDKIHIGPVLGGLVGDENEFAHGFHLGFEF